MVSGMRSDEDETPLATADMRPVEKRRHNNSLITHQSEYATRKCTDSHQHTVFTFIKTVLTVLEEFKYLGTTLTNQNSTVEEIKSRLRSGNACYHSARIFCFPDCYPKI